MSSLAGLAVALVPVFLVVLSVAVYFSPVLWGWHRHVPDLGSVAAINVLLGWTVIGWAVAWAMALRSPRPQGPSIQVINNPPLPPPYPAVSREYAPPGHDLAAGRQPADAPGLLPLPPPGPPAGPWPDQASRTDDAR